MVLACNGTSYGNVTLFDVRVGNTPEPVADVLLVIDDPNYLHGTEAGLWHLDEETGTDVLDSSGNEQHGVISGAVTNTTQDVVSFHNEIGYTLSDGTTYYKEVGLSKQ